MKKLMMMLLSLSFLGATAMAFEGAFVPSFNGNATIQPLKAYCPEKPVKNGNYCQPAGKSCGAGYDQFAKLCWGGWHHGFYRCGISCKPKEQCAWNATGDYRCYPNLENGGGQEPHFAATMSGALQVNESGAVELLNAKKSCEDLNSDDAHDGNVCLPADGSTCHSPYKRMHRYCWGGWSKGLYRCGIACVSPNEPTQN